MALSPFYGNVNVVDAYEQAKARNQAGEMQQFKQYVTLKQLLDEQAFKQQQLGQQTADRAATREATAAQREATLALQRDAMAQRSAEAEAARRQRMEELKLRLSEGRATAQEAAAMKRELAQLSAGVQRELGQLRADTQKEVAGMRAETSPSAIKEREKVEGKTSVTALLDELSADYGQLKTLGADISPQRGAITNIANRIAASGPGQLVTGAVGTKPQEIRDSIAAKRASLMAAIKQATGMGATQLNSNVELQFYLKMATDPTMARGANEKAIKWLRDTYGIKGGAAAPVAPASGLSPQEQQELDQLRKQFGR